MTGEDIVLTPENDELMKEVMDARRLIEDNYANQFPAIIKVIVRYAN